ncbi:MAG TPA: SAM-dependent methyltransferase, partial [Burkholderiales bacterium]|nr:SAM-dependent methyltransferase [Burkholderiales bacterium]
MLVGLSLVSAAALAYEILLTRLFSIIQWHHFAYMMISVALLGYGAAGAAVTLARERVVPRLAAVLSAAATLFAVTAAGGFLLAQRVPFNPLEFLWDPKQPLLLLLIYLLLFVPFFFAALYVCLMFTHFGRQAGRVYSYDILGAAAGCLGVVLALLTLAPLSVLGAIALCALCAAALPALTRGRAGALAAACCAVLGIGAVWVLSGPLSGLQLSPYKELSQTLEVMGTRVVAASSGPLGWLTVVESPDVPLRHAPGLSLNAPDEPPEQLALFTDGEGLTPITRFDGRREPLAYLDFVTSAAAYHVLQRPQVLVLGAGTGADVLQALYHSARSVDAVELNPAVARLVEREFADFAGRPLSRPGVSLHIAEARAFATASRRRYDLVQLALLDAFGASSAGLYALAESYLYTVESLQIYLRRLAPGGILSITRWVTLPPRDTLKLFGMAVLALEREGVRQPGQRLVLVRGWRTATLLVKNGDWTDADVQRLKTFAAQRSFDFGWYRGMRLEDADRHNILDRPYFYEGTSALLGPRR